MFFLSKPPEAEREKFKCHYADPLSLAQLSDKFSKYLLTVNKQGQREIVVVCIGTDRATGDCLGPLVGWNLKRHPINFPFYGTLNDPIHGANLVEKINYIKSKHSFPLIIAIDACLGKLESVGTITVGLGEIFPGAGVHKKLPGVGEIYFTGTVNVSGYMEFLVLQNTRLSLVMNMATKITHSVIFGIKKAQAFSRQESSL